MKKLIALFLALVCVFGLIGCGKQAEPIVLPALDEIDSINITTFDNSEFTYSDKEWIEQFIDILTNTETTSKESVQDIPNLENYGKVDISYNNKISTIFYYTEKGNHYIEQPYQGIYVTDVDIDVFIKGIE